MADVSERRVESRPRGGASEGQRTISTPYRFRPDIEGLRAVAVVAVILFHVGAPLSDGGFVGVDVFFVVSGFLITGLMLKERGSTGGISLLGFYARRVRRILPASTVVLVATLVASRLVLSPLQQIDTAADARAAAMFVSNIRFAAQENDYFAAVTTDSPFQHYWSLSLEEQFYLVWPALLIVVGLAAGALFATRRTRRGVVIALGALVVGASFVLSVALTQESQPLAFYLLVSRAWELGVGAVLAFGLVRFERVSPRVSAALGWAGLAAIAFAVVRFGPSSPFPGWIAAIPVVGTALVIIAGSGRNRSFSPTGALSLAPAQWIGRRSYSLYLWHWPVLVLARAVAPETFGPWRAALLLVLFTVVPLSMLSFRFVEQPPRLSKALAANTRASLLFGAALIAVAVLAAAPIWYDQDLATSRAASPVDPGGDPPASPTLFVPANLEPSLKGAREDRSLATVDGCNVARGQASPDSDCVYGDESSERQVVVFGDSHAEQWVTTLAEAASRNGWKLVSLTKSACTSYWDETKWSDDAADCARWRQASLDRIVADQPDVVIVSNRSDVDFRKDPDGWGAQMKAALERLPDDTEVVVLGQNPVADENVPDCLSEHLEDTKRCGPSPDDRHLVSLVDLQRRVSAETGSTFVDLRDWLCHEGSCPAIVGNTLVYRDDDHVTNAYSLLLGDHFDELLRPLMAGDPARS